VSTTANATTLLQRGDASERSSGIHVVPHEADATWRRPRHRGRERQAFWKDTATSKSEFDFALRKSSQSEILLRDRALVERTTQTCAASRTSPCSKTSSAILSLSPRLIPRGLRREKMRHDQRLVGTICTRKSHSARAIANGATTVCPGGSPTARPAPRRRAGGPVATAQRAQAVDGAVRRVRFDVGEVNYGRDVTQFAVNGTCFEEVRAAGARRFSRTRPSGDPRMARRSRSLTPRRSAQCARRTGLREFDNELRRPLVASSTRGELGSGSILSWVARMMRTPRGSAAPMRMTNC